MNRLKKIAIGILVVAILSITLYLLFFNTTGFTNREELINSYFASHDDPAVCTTHFNSETQDFCLTFTALLEDKTVELTSVTVNDTENTADISVLLDGTTVTFIVHFYTEEIEGLKGIIYSNYYYIDVIE